ncbi:G-protein coupled receptor dmsr-1-like [Babylonia areolata]|uniref:G-protein coupled receptor dmsr-1-like n=1 Tax=Babylonia areolata TaxID=304850 RepID=UPI003FCEF794
MEMIFPDDTTTTAAAAAAAAASGIRNNYYYNYNNYYNNNINASGMENLSDTEDARRLLEQHLHHHNNHNHSHDHLQPHLLTDDPAGLTGSLMTFQLWFQGFHGYASIVVCVFGVATNFFNVTILMRKDMRTPTNILLMWLAVSDILTMLPYVPFVGNFYCPPTTPFSHPERFSYGWMVYMLVMINFVATTHTISIWIGVSLAAVRFIQMRSTSRGHAANERRIRQAKIVTLLVYILSCVVLVPNYLTNKLELVEVSENLTFYTIQDLKLATNQTRSIVLINVVTYAVVAKLIPCVLILIFSGSLVYTLTVKGRGRRRRLATSSCSKTSARARQATTTRMLLVVIILFIITELPQGVLILLSATLPGFYGRVYLPLGDLMDFIALLNNAINFVLYCIMSQQFRARFAHMYLRRRVRLKPASCETTTTTNAEKLTLREPPTRTTGME